MAKAAFNKNMALFTSKMGLELRKKLVKCYIWSIALHGDETWTLRAVDQKHLERFEMWCWRRMEKISWTDHVKTDEVLLRVNACWPLVPKFAGSNPAEAVGFFRTKKSSARLPSDGK
jgi:hypothetical protein